MDDTDPNTITLEQPLTRGEQTITAITVTPPQGCGALRGLNLSDVMQMNTDALVKLLPRVTNPTLTEKDVYDLSPADLLAMGVRVTAFLLPKSAQAGLAAG